MVKYVLVRKAGRYTLATGLDPSLTWTVRIWKVSENFNHGSWQHFSDPWFPPYENKPFLLANSTGVMWFNGFEAPQDVQWLECTTQQFQSKDVGKLDFMGDSDTAGFCVDGPADLNPDTDDLTKFDFVNATNAYSNWASRIARSFGAEMTIEAVGRPGVVAVT